MQRSDKLNLAQRRWTRNPKGAKKPKEVKFAVETMEMNETVKNKLKDARIAKIKNESKLGKLQ